MDIKLEKQRLRKRILEQRDRQSPAYRAEQSVLISEKLLSMNEYIAANVIAGFVSFGSEIDMARFMTCALEDGKKIALPRVRKNENRVVFHCWSGSYKDLVPGAWGIQEPDPHRSREVELTQIDFVLVPGVAFSESRHRMGYGGGYYDRVITGLAPHAVTVAPIFPMQIVAHVPLESHDRRVDWLITS